MMAKTRLEEMVDHPDVVEHFKTQPISSLREAMKYILPKSLDEPCYHCFHYFDAIEVAHTSCLHTFSCCAWYMYSLYLDYGFILLPVSVSNVT